MQSPIFPFVVGNIRHDKCTYFCFPRRRRGKHKNIIDTFIYKISGDNSIYDIIYVITRTRLKKSHIYVLISIY